MKFMIVAILVSVSVGASAGEIDYSDKLPRFDPQCDVGSADERDQDSEWFRIKSFSEVKYRLDKEDGEQLETLLSEYRQHMNENNILSPEVDIENLGNLLVRKLYVTKSSGTETQFVVDMRYSGKLLGATLYVTGKLGYGVTFGGTEPAKLHITGIFVDSYCGSSWSENSGIAWGPLNFGGNLSQFVKAVVEPAMTRQREAIQNELTEHVTWQTPVAPQR